MTDTVTWPSKTREVETRILESTRWNHVNLRDDDIVVATFAKTGTTLTQQMVGQIVTDGSDGVAAAAESYWIDQRFGLPLPELLALVEAQTHRRFLKTHLPFDALVFSPMVKYIYVGRDARDVIWSAYNHHAAFTPAAYEMINSAEGGSGPKYRPPDLDVRDYYLRWLDGAFVGCFNDEPFWPHFQGWWDQRQLPNVLLLHYSKLISDLPGEMRRIAAFLDIEIDESRLPIMIEHCSIDYMRAQAADVPFLNLVFESGAASFFNKGANGRWRDVLSPREIARCDEVADANLTPACAHWLKTGEVIAE